MGYECYTCTRVLATPRARAQHMNALGHWGTPDFECEYCGEEFYTEDELDEHVDDCDRRPPDIECDTCSECFYTRDECDDHMDDYHHHGPEVECETCTRRFFSQQSCDQHMDALGHWAHYCQECKRGFQSANNLKMHLNSSTHRGRTIACPFCQTAFATASGVAHHLEAPACPKAKGMTREKLHAAIRARDPGGLITAKLLEWNHSAQPTSSAWSSSQAWNGRGYECYLCHKTFGAPRSLDQHLASPTHAQRSYYCPNGSCGREFVALAPLLSHLESESCAFMRFEKVQQQVGNVIAGSRMLSFG